LAARKRFRGHRRRLRRLEARNGLHQTQARSRASTPALTPARRSASARPSSPADSTCNSRRCACVSFSGGDLPVVTRNSVVRRLRGRRAAVGTIDANTSPGGQT